MQLNGKNISLDTEPPPLTLPSVGQMKKKVTIALLIILTLWIGASVIALSAFLRAVPDIHRQDPPSHIRARVNPIPQPVLKYPVYPHSVLPGGIHDAADLQRAFQGRFLPADFNLSNARFIRISKPFCTYVTFRNKDGQIVWSNHKICIRAGEVAITDGKYTLLGRCGNRIAMSLPTDAPAQMAPIDLDIPVAEVSTNPGVVSSLYPNPTPETWIPPVGPVDIGSGGALSLPPVPPTFWCCAEAPAVRVPDGSRWAVTLLTGFVLGGAIVAKAHGYTYGKRVRPNRT